MGCGASRRQHSANAIAPCKDDPEKGLIPRRDSLLHEWVQTMQTDIFTGLLNACDDAIYNDGSCQPFPQLKEADIDGVIQRFVPSLRAILLRPHAKIVEVSRISSSSTGTTGYSQSQTPSRSSRTEGNGGMHQSSVADSSSNHGLGRTLSDQQECHTGEKGGVKIQVEATRAPSSVASASDETLTRSLSHPQGGAALDAGFAKAPSSVALRAPPSRSNTGIDEAAVAASEAFHRTPSNASRQWGRTLSMDDFPQSSSDDNCGRLSSSVSGTFMIHRLASEEVNAVDIAASAPNSDFQRAPSAPVSIQGFLETKTAAAFTMSLPATDFARTWSIEKQRISTVKEEGSESDLEEDSFEEDVAQAPEHNFQSVKVALQSMGGGMGEALKSMPFKSSSRPAKLPDPKSYAKATCLFFDIVEFSKICAERSSEDVGQWLLKIHEVVEVNMRQHAVQIVEIRGDCYICITGTQHVAGDRPESQMTRMVAFAAGVQRTLAGKLSTPVRIGVATGACTIGYIRANNSTVNVCAYGDTINMAARMEQNGKPGRVLLTAAAARVLRQENPDNNSDRALPVRMTNVKGKGPFPTVWFDSESEDFLDEPEDEFAAKPAPPLGRRYSFPCGARGADVTVKELQAHLLPSGP